MSNLDKDKIEMNTLVRAVLRSLKKGTRKKAYEEFKSILEKHDLLEGGLNGPFTHET